MKTNKETTKICMCGSLLGESIDDRLIPLTKGQ